MKHTNIRIRKSRSAILIGGGITMSAALLTRFWGGSPLWLIHIGNTVAVLPPYWLLSLLWLLSFFAVGVAGSFLLASTAGGCRREVCFWRGSTFLVFAVVFSLVWYVLLFGKRYFVCSLLFSVLSAGASFLGGISWLKIHKIAGMIAWGFAVWQCILLFLQISVLFHL